MKITAEQGDLIILGNVFSILVTKQDNGSIEGWPINNAQIPRIFPGSENNSLKLIKNNTLATFSLNGCIGTVTWYPEKEYQILSGREKYDIHLPDIVIAYIEELNFVRIAGTNSIKEGKFLKNPMIFSLGQFLPNFTDAYSVCFGDEALPNDPDKIYHEFLTRPFGTAGRNGIPKDLRNPSKDSYVRLENMLTDQH